jgi:addiction module HigA family antidote
METPTKCAVRITTDVIPTDRPPTHPGEMLLEEFLKPLGLTQADAARRMGITTNRMNELVRGKRGVTADTALRLARLLGTSPEIWLDLQGRWDLYHAAKRLQKAG